MKYLKLLTVFFLVFTCSSCLEHGLDELDTYDGAEITGIVGVYYRYYSDEKLPVNNEVRVLQTTLSTKSKVDSEAGTCALTVSLPSNFPAAEKSKVSNKALVVIVNISSAAVVKPLDDAPAFGTPGDWSKTNRYEVTAADGTKKIWSVTLTLNQ